jgi:hypothetical protein
MGTRVAWVMSCRVFERNGRGGVTAPQASEIVILRSITRGNRYDMRARSASRSNSTSSHFVPPSQAASLSDGAPRPTK